MTNFENLFENFEEDNPIIKVLTALSTDPTEADELLTGIYRLYGPKTYSDCLRIITVNQIIFDTSEKDRTERAAILLEGM